MTGEIVQIGIGSRDASLDLRERLQPDDAQREFILERAARFAHEQVLLSTCERLEWYAAANGLIDAEMLRVWAAAFDVPLERIEACAVVRTGDAASRHLLRVAAGLESRIAGEHHVLGQVRATFRDACERGAVGPVLSALWRAAIHAGKRVRSETVLGRGMRSAAAGAADVIRRHVGSRCDRRIVIVGAGRMARDVLEALRTFDPGRIVIVNRRVARARELADGLGAQACSLEDLVALVREADALVACTSSPSFILTATDVGDRAGHPLAVVDLGVPRNVDPLIAGTRGVTLAHLESLETHRAEDRAVAAAESIVEDELHRFRQWHSNRRAASAITRLVLNRHAVDRRALHTRIMRLKAEVAA